MIGVTALSRKRPHVLVMMASYNGEQYIAEQIDSILDQQGVNISLVIRDDGSSDSTPQICEEYASKHTNISFSRNERNVGPANNFMRMVKDAEVDSFDYFAFSDQDDYWLPNKLDEAIKLLENASNEPLLYYSDVHNTDENLNGSESELSCFSRGAANIQSALTMSGAYGCTEVFNSSLCKIIQTYIPEEMLLYHDQWLNITALACGHTIPDLHRSFIKRRITGSNVAGKREGAITPKIVLNVFLDATKKVDHRFTRAAEQILLEYSDFMTADSKSIIKEFVAGTNSLQTRCKLAMDNAYIGPSPFDTIILRLRLLFNRF